MKLVMAAARRSLVLLVLMTLGVPDSYGATAATGTISGKVLDAQGKPLEGACVVICGQASGIPLHRKTLRPFTEQFLKGQQAMDLAHRIADKEGHFLFRDVPEGEYRLIAQSWEATPAPKGLLQVNGKEVQFHGLAEHVRISAGKSAAGLVLRPLGTGALRMDLDMPNSETLLLISTSPPRADAILGFVGWGGAFLRHMIGGNRMPYGETTVSGLPEGKVYLVLFAADSAPGFGAAEVEVRSNATAVVNVQMVASWSNARHDPPERLRALFEEMNSLVSQRKGSVRRILGDNDIHLEPSRGFWGKHQQQIVEHLDRQVTLPSGHKTNLGDFMAATGYIQLQRLRKQRRERLNRQGK